MWVWARPAVTLSPGPHGGPVHCAAFGPQRTPGHGTPSAGHCKRGDLRGMYGHWPRMDRSPSKSPLSLSGSHEPWSHLRGALRDFGCPVASKRTAMRGVDARFNQARRGGRGSRICGSGSHPGSGLVHCAAVDATDEVGLNLCGMSHSYEQIEELLALLKSLQAEHGAMTPGELEGYVTALIVCPETAV